MSSAIDLSTVGMPTEQSIRVGLTSGAITAAGTTSTTATAIPPQLTFVILTAASSQTGAILSSSVELLTPIYIVNPSGTSGEIFPPSGQSINGATATTGSMTVDTLGGAIFVRYSATAWAAFIGKAG